MESILFSLNSVMPLFLMGIAGYLLVQRGVVNENFVDQASNLCFKLLIPFSLFREVYDAKVLDSFDFRLEKQPPVGLFHIAVDVNRLPGSDRQIDGHEGFSGTALAA